MMEKHRGRIKYTLKQNGALNKKKNAKDQKIFGNLTKRDKTGFFPSHGRDQIRKKKKLGRMTENLKFSQVVV